MDASLAALDASLRLYSRSGYSGLVNVLMAWHGGGVVRRRATGARRNDSAGDLIVFVTYLASLYGPINALSQTTGLIQGATAGARRVFECSTRA